MSLADDLQAATLEFDGEAGRARMRFSGEELFFKGHFPDGPVLPAVVQVAAAVHFAGRVLGREVKLAEVSRAKFMNPTGPGRELTLALTLEEAEEGRTKVKAQIREGDKDVAEFTLRVA
ncbi:MAG: hypothetical protein KDB82_07510 [Planctomycetes bacterium]|nr:hypothetical protein [Planctomycetota bacterium]